MEVPRGGSSLYRFFVRSIAVGMRLNCAREPFINKAVADARAIQKSD
jgi:hypothetical protein